MQVSDADSILHLIRTISPWGFLFIILFLLPIYLALWTGIFKLLDIKASGFTKVFIPLLLAFSISLVLLKVGLEQDKEKKLLGERIKNYLITYGYKGASFDRLKNDAVPTSNNEDLENLIERFPEDFTLSYFPEDKNASNKGIMLTNEAALKRINQLHEEILPIAFVVLKNHLKNDSTATYDQIFKIDDRFNYEIIEMLAVRYPSDFKIITTNYQNQYFLKKIR